MSGTHGGFDPLARRTFRIWQEIDTARGADGYAQAMADLVETAAVIAADDGRVVAGMTFTIRRVTGGALQLVATGDARVASPGTIDARAIGASTTTEGDAP